uniref:AMP-dependent synthetase/ligase domain-containing protein n=1 Tax=Ciona savignyi TaxID=51511 RepID=H2YHJ7_CIOSA
MSDPILSKPRSHGFVTPNGRMKVVDLSTGKSLGCGVSGELLFKSPQVVKGYYKNLEATKNMFDSEGWFKTGDIGYFDEEGNVYISGRMKDVIKIGSAQVSPPELEAVLFEHPKIADVGVIGVPDLVGDAIQVPKAFIVKGDPSLTKEEIHSFVKEKLARYKHLRGGIEFVDELQKNATGKIRKELLRKLHQ